MLALPGGLPVFGYEFVGKHFPGASYRVHHHEWAIRLNSNGRLLSPLLTNNRLLTFSEAVITAALMNRNLREVSENA